VYAVSTAVPPVALALLMRGLVVPAPWRASALAPAWAGPFTALVAAWLAAGPTGCASPPVLIPDMSAANAAAELARVMMVGDLRLWTVLSEDKGNLWSGAWYALGFRP
jgi:hypothetical protein